jgi:hypothetical protein
VGTSSGEAGIQISFGYGGTSGFTAGFGVGGEVSTAETLDDLEQTSVFAGGSIRAGRGVSGDVAVSNSAVTGSASVGIGASFTPPYAPGGEVHGGASYTETIVEGELPDMTFIGLGVPELLPEEGE